MFTKDSTLPWQSNHYFEQYIQGEKNKTCQQDITTDEMYYFTPLIIQMGHDDWGNITGQRMATLYNTPF
jgi:hypothetical protein